jgi:hypothetical protein
MSPRPLPEWEVLLEPFRPLFTTPGYRYFCAFVWVLAHLDRRLWVTRMILAGLVDRHFTSCYRVLRHEAVCGGLPRRRILFWQVRMQAPERT